MMEKEKALEMALSQIEKQFGKGAIMKLGDAAAKISVSTISTGCLALDLALGVGGIPRGRIIEIYGPESSGKTTIALHVIAEAQKAGGAAAFIDAEHALDPVYAENLGVNVDELYVSQPDTGEQALEITEALVRSGAIDVVVIDSVAALVPKAEIEGDMGDSHVGLQARLMSQALRKLAGVISKSNTIVIFINQLREKVGVMFGNPETTTGGKALKFYASIRMDVRKIDVIKNGTEIVGGVIAVIDGFLYRIQFAFFTGGKHFKKYHFVLKVVEDNEVLIQDVEHIRCVVGGFAAIFYGNIFKIAYGIERGVAIKTAVIGIFAFHMEAAEEIL